MGVQMIKKTVTKNVNKLVKSLTGGTYSYQLFKPSGSDSFITSDGETFKVLSR